MVETGCSTVVVRRRLEGDVAFVTGLRNDAARTVALCFVSVGAFSYQAPSVGIVLVHYECDEHGKYTQIIKSILTFSWTSLVSLCHDVRFVSQPVVSICPRHIFCRIRAAKLSGGTLLGYALNSVIILRGGEDRNTVNVFNDSQPWRKKHRNSFSLDRDSFSTNYRYPSNVGVVNGYVRTPAKLGIRNNRH